MARAILKEPITDSAGNVQGAVSCTIYEADGTTLLTETMYPTLTSSTPLANPFSSSANGYLEAYAPLPRRVRVKVSGVTTPFDAEFKVDPASLGQSAGGTAKFDGKQSFTGTTSSGQNFVNVPITGDFTGFTSADIGKRIVVIQVGTLDAIIGGQTETNVLNSTITAIQTSSRVTTAASPSATISGSARVLWGTDDTTALQALFDTTQASSSNPLGTEIRLPAGITFATNLSLAARSGIRLVGAGAVAQSTSAVYQYGTMIVGYASGATLTINGERNELVGFAIDGAGKVATKGLDIGGGAYFLSMRQVTVNGAVTGISCAGSAANLFNTDLTNVVVEHCTNGYDFEPTGSSAVQKLYFYDCAAQENSGAGYLFGPAVSLVGVHGGSCQSNAYGVRLTGGASSSGPAAIRFRDTHFEGNFTRAVDIVKSGGQYGAIASSFGGCAFYGGGAGFTGTMVHSDGALYVSFDHPFISTWPTGSTIWDFTGTSTNSFGNVVGIDAEYIGVAGTVYGNTKGLSVGYGVSARFTASGDQTIANGGSGTFLAWDTVVTDPYQGLTSATIFTIPVSGNYRITGAATVGASAAGTYRVCSIYVDAVAVEIAYKLPSTVVPCDFHLSTELPLTAGQTVRLNVLADNGTLSVTHGGYGPWLVVTRLP